MRTSTSQTNIDGSVKSATLCASAKQLVKVFGEPEYTQSYDKVNHLWIYSFGEDRVITIYDYKEKRSFDKINEWSVGAKNVLYVDVLKFINDQFKLADEEYRELV